MAAITYTPPWMLHASHPHEILKGPLEPTFTTSAKQTAETEKSPLDRFLVTVLYPTQNSITKRLWQTDNLDLQRSQLSTSLLAKGYIVKHIKLSHKNVNYSGLLIAHSQTFQNGKWVLQATGITNPIEKHLCEIDYVEKYHSIGYNLVMMNGPGVGRSEGTADGKTVGDPQEAGLEFLESAVKAKHIVFAGFSRGGPEMAQATLAHQFNPKVHHYLGIKQMSYDKLSNVIQHFTTTPGLSALTRMAGSLVSKSDCDGDCLRAAKKLSELNIQEVIIQSGTDSENFLDDPLIPKKAALAPRMQEEGITDGKRFIAVCGKAGIRSPASHNPQLDTTIVAIKEWEISISPPKEKTFTKHYKATLEWDTSITPPNPTLTTALRRLSVIQLHLRKS